MLTLGVLCKPTNIHNKLPSKFNGFLEYISKKYALLKSFTLFNRSGRAQKFKIAAKSKMAAKTFSSI
jgi:hypothetical protein